MPDISPTLARDDGRKFGEHLVALKLAPVVRSHAGRVPTDVEEATVAAIDEAMQDELLERHTRGVSEKTLELFRKQAWRAVEKGLNDLRREFRHG